MTIEQITWRSDGFRPPSGGWKLKTDSLSKLKIYMPGQQGAVTRYSYDWQHPKSTGRSQRLGALRLQKLLEKNFKGYRSALLVDIPSDSILIIFTPIGYKIN